MAISKNKIDGMIYGFAFGDAWGYVTEFMLYSQIVRKKVKPPHVLRVSDDTQMSLYNLAAIKDMMKRYSSDDLKELGQNVDLQNQIRMIFASHHVDFYHDLENNRAPGMTCMRALGTYLNTRNVSTGMEGATNNSNGCGTVMRAPWFGALPYDRETVAYLAIIQAQTTHGSHVGWIASALAALLTRDLLNMNSDNVLGSKFIHYAKLVLSEIAKMPSNLVQNAQDGVQHLRNGLSQLGLKWDDFLDAPTQTDMTSFFGEGWVADETLYNAIIAVAAYSSRSIYKGIQRLVWTNGDSDSLAAVGGAFLGAFKGYEALQYDVKSNLENRYQVELSAAAETYYKYVQSMERMNRKMSI